MGKQAFILLTNKSTDAVVAMYNALEKATVSYGNCFVMYHQTGEELPGAIKTLPHCIFTNNILHHTKYKPIGETIVPGSNHFPLLDFYAQNAKYDFYWYIEDDVRFSADWNDLFSNCTDSHAGADFISSHLRTFAEEPAWIWWDTLVHPFLYILPQARTRSFNPVFRISNAALRAVCSLQADGWKGHHEVLIPTLLQMEGFSVADFGGTGKFVPKGCQNKYYIGEQADATGYLKQGSMRFRPLISQTEIVSNKLYHPVK